MTDEHSTEASRFVNFSREQYALGKKEIARRTVARFARGNVALQYGDYVTRAELDARLEQMARELVL